MLRHPLGIRVDSADAGRSALADGISIQPHADDLAAVLDQLGIESAAVVGHSMGTLVVRDLAARYPGRVSKLALLGAVAPPANAVRQAQRDRAALLREKGTAAVEAPRRGGQRPVRGHPPGQARGGRVRPRAGHAAGPGRLRPQLRGTGRRGRPRAGGRRTAALLVTGSEDRTAPPTVSEVLAAGRSEASVTVINGIGHWTALEAAREVTEQLLKFL